MSNRNILSRKLGFILKKHKEDSGMKYVAVCTLCKKTLRNAATNRLILHRYGVSNCSEGYINIESVHIFIFLGKFAAGLMV